MNIFENFTACFTIAEIGVNHNGDMNLAREMIHAAKEAGADAVKFQTFKAETLVSQYTPKVEYQKITTSAEESHFEMIKSLELSYDNHFLLMDYCLNKKIKFLSTPYDVESARFLHEGLGVEMFKTASADLVDHPLHEYIASTQKPSIVSVGMANLDEIGENLAIYKSHNQEDIILLHCVSNYPCSHESLNLRVMEQLRTNFNFPVGFSDHSVGNDAALLSVALGAKVIEKHFTLDKNLKGPDHAASATPDEFKNLTTAIKTAEKILGTFKKGCQLEEAEMSQISRKSIFLKTNALKDDILSEGNLVCLRPGTGIYPSFLNKIIGRRLKYNLAKGTQLDWSHLI